MPGKAQTSRCLPDGAKCGDSPGDASSSVLDFTADMSYYVSPVITVAGQRPQDHSVQPKS